MEDDLRRLIALAEIQDVLLRTFELDCVCQQFKCGAAGADPWIAFPQPSRIHILVDERATDAPHRRYRADYRPQVIQSLSGTPARADTIPPEEGFVVRNSTEIGDGYRTTSYAKEHRWHPSVHLSATDIYLAGERFLLSRFGSRKAYGEAGPIDSEPVRLARAILEPEHSVRAGIEQRTANWETIGDERRVLRLEQAFTDGGRHIYWLDPECGYALIRFAEAEANEEPSVLFEVEEFAQVTGDFWYPARVSSDALSPSPGRTSPVRIASSALPAGLLPRGHTSEVIRYTVSSRVPRESSVRCQYGFSNVRVGIEIPSDALEFRPPNV